MDRNTDRARLASWLSRATYCLHGLALCRQCTREARELGLLPSTITQ